jgi:hypothetical protein
MTERWSKAEWEARLREERLKAENRRIALNSRAKQRLQHAIEALRTGATGLALELLEDVALTWNENVDVRVSKVPGSDRDERCVDLMIELALGNMWFRHQERFDRLRPPPGDCIVRAMGDGLLYSMRESVFVRAQKEIAKLYPDGDINGDRK